MKIITTREFRNNTKAFFEMAREDRVAVKRKKEYVIQTVTDDPAKTLLDEEWVRDFFAIPKEFRVNPFDVSPSGDVFYADLRNVEEMNRRFEQVKVDMANGVKYQSWEEVKKELGL